MVSMTSWFLLSPSEQRGSGGAPVGEPFLVGQEWAPRQHDKSKLTLGSQDRFPGGRNIQADLSFMSRAVKGMLFWVRRQHQGVGGRKGEQETSS